ncbi:hypothetical protein [Heterosigma akashiwo virus 01]|uniref:Uncharacterized protein n=1 Tax=Heterosigma akashiwo virus 01 TaxID=97195 RepID=A0A1C9C5K8_HAV01|nr:hypothetical protein D1R72_gp236 [Heterosigma akashiwo virus 01]AOM63567.1 hypothetical protein [Heterosigma akashiwo virus 01]
MPHVEISYGELIDKYSILLIKNEKLKEESSDSNGEKVLNIINEMGCLEPKVRYMYSIYDNMIEEQHEQFKKTVHEKFGIEYYDLQDLFEKIHSINMKLWDIEDQLRDKERLKIFDQEFVELARSVYKTNDNRARYKKIVNVVFNSNIIEEKLYSNY